MATINYTPPPIIKKFIKHYKPGELFTDWIIGPVGSGKTTGIFFKLIYMAMLQAASPVDGIRRSRCVIVRSTMPQLRDTTIKSFNYWFKYGQAGKWKATTNDFILRFGDVECEVMFRPLDTPDDVDRVLSLEVTFAIIDEFVQIPQQIVDALAARCGRYPPIVEGGATNWGMWGASNPGNESDWWYPHLEDHEALPEGVEPADWTYFKQPSGFSPEAENLDNLPGKEAYYTNLAKGKSKNWTKQFIEVCWGFSHAGKPVFPMFDINIHVSKKPMEPIPGLQLAIGYDPGVHSGITIGQYTDFGQVRVYDAIALDNYTTERMITERLKPLLRRKYPNYEVVVIPDPSSANRAQAQDTSVMQVLKKHFAVKADTNNQIESRLAPAEYYMLRLTGSGPALQIDPTGCAPLIRALKGGYRYAATRQDAPTKDIPDKNIHSNIADAFTYLLRYFRSGEELAGRRAVRPTPVSRSRNTYNLT
ncbi:MAG: hypothetical protein ACKO0Z_00525 [Betaproteobacteria bacterium]